MTELCRLRGVSKVHTTLYHPHANEVVEQNNTVLEGSLRLSFYTEDNKSGMRYCPTYCVPTEGPLHHYKKPELSANIWQKAQAS